MSTMRNDCSEMAAKNVIADLNKGEKLDGVNYDTWQRKIQYLLNEHEVLETLTTSMDEPKAPTEGDDTQYRLDMEVYNTWFKRDRSARFIMLSAMQDDVQGNFVDCKTAKEMWEVLRSAFGTTSATRLRALPLKFESYTMNPKHTMAEHLRAMSAMIRELKAAGYTLTDE